MTVRRNLQGRIATKNEKKPPMDTTYISSPMPKCCNLGNLLFLYGLVKLSNLENVIFQVLGCYRSKMRKWVAQIKYKETGFLIFSSFQKVRPQWDYTFAFTWRKWTNVTDVFHNCETDTSIYFSFIRFFVVKAKEILSLRTGPQERKETIKAKHFSRVTYNITLGPSVEWISK